MKRILLFLGILITACSSINKHDTEFKNPVFNQPLRPLSRTVGYAYLTPTSAEFRGVLDKNVIIYTSKCKLIENKQDRITLKCKGKWDNGTEHNTYLTYVIKQILEYVPSCLRILEYDYSTPEDFPKNEMHSAKYCVTPPDYIKLESD